MFIGELSQQKPAVFVCSVGAGVTNQTLTTNQAKGKRGVSMLPVCTYGTSDHALMGWYLKGYWLNEFSQYLPFCLNKWVIKLRQNYIQ